MTRNRLRTLVLIGVVSLISIFIVQFLWLNNTVRIQRIHLRIQAKEDSLNLRQFMERTEIALQDVVETIREESKDSSDQYGAVKAISPTTFSVDINSELQPDYLEVLLIREFYQEHIRQDFQYGIYDCFIDSIVSGNIIRYTKDSLFVPEEREHTLRQPKLPKKDGHYFTVHFPSLNPFTKSNTTFDFTPTWYVIISVLVVFAFFTYSILLVFQQKRLADLKNDFINNMTHELKTPIATIGLTSEMLLKHNYQDDPEKLSRYAGIIFKENKRLENQVERVLNVAKLDREQLILHKETIDLSEMLGEVVETITQSQLADGGSIRFESPKQSICIVADPVHISNVLYNLLDNAIKYSSAEPDICVELEQTAEHVFIHFSDKGIGLRREDLKLIFEKFYRVPTGNLHNVKGFGLGLYYVKLIVEAHQGKIEVKSKLNEGSTFTICLPLSV